MTERLRRGLFITLEGGDGSGKSTQSRALASHLRRDGFAVQVTAEPGGTDVGRHVRQFFEQGAPGGGPPVAAWAEVFLFEAARAQNVEEVIRPALERGEIVLCDRFTDSTIAYQGYGRRLSLDEIERCNRIAAGGLKPHLTLLMDVPAEDGLARAGAAALDPASGRAPDALGGESLEFHRRVRQGYLDLANREPGRIVLLDATLPQEPVTKLAWEHLRALLEKAGEQER
jgi:dTMP kinase